MKELQRRREYSKQYYHGRKKEPAKLSDEEVAQNLIDKKEIL